MAGERGKATLGLVGGLALLAGLAAAGDAAAGALGLGVPGEVIGFGLYLVLLASGRGGWSLPGARLAVAWLGALLVAPLASVAGDLGPLRPVAPALALAFLAGVATTVLATALTFRLATRL